MQTVLTIAGFDPSSGAGITADLMVFAAHRLFGTSAITALTVQSTVGVRSTHPVSAEILRDTLDCLHADLPPAGIKIGMLANAASVQVVCGYLYGVSAPVVLDPVVRSTSGRDLLDSEGFKAMRQTLLPLVDWVTPNLDELSLLTGLPVTGRDDLPAAARRLQSQVETRSHKRIGIIATGGHLDPPDDFILTPSGNELWLPGVRVDTRATHGTGCAFSSAFLCRIVRGDDPFQAARMAKEYVAESMKAAVSMGEGISAMSYLHEIDKV